MRVLDLFCCGGGAAMGYHKAGFEVVGVDIEPQPNYPFEFLQENALHMLDFVSLYSGRNGFTKYDLIHASPPCQAYSSHVSSKSSKWVPTKGKDEPMLIDTVRYALSRMGIPYAIENVMGAKKHMNANLQLCGTMFGLPISRHRLFETSFFIEQPEHPQCIGVAKEYAAKRGWEYRDMSVTGKGRRKGTTERWKEIMGIEHDMTQHQLAEAIPPAYTEYIGNQFKKYL